MSTYTGIGFRKDFAEELLSSTTLRPSFIEVAPENWMNIGGYWKKMLKKAREAFPLYAHGLSLSIGSPDPLDLIFLKQVKQFLEEFDIAIYSEHLSYSKCDNAHLYDLLPIPFQWKAVHHISDKVKQVQDFLGRNLALEIVSYYTPVAAEMSELEFINNIVEESNCDLLLDVNNVYVNGFNHSYDPKAFLKGLPLDRVVYIHMAGHEQVSEDLILDTHGQPIIDPVYDLLDFTVNLLPAPVPVLLERDFNIPELAELQTELQRLDEICKNAWSHESLLR